MKSYWEIFRKKFKQYPKIIKDINTDVCIIGGGLTGLSVAYYLSKNVETESKQKLDIVILEKTTYVVEQVLKILVKLQVNMACFMII